MKQYLQIGIFASLFLISNITFGQAGNVVLWNKLGSESEVTHSEIGPNGEIVGEILFEPGQHGNGFRSAARTGDHNVPNNFIRFPGLQLGPQGCIEFWYHPDWTDRSVGHVIDIVQYGIPEQDSSIKIFLGFNDWQNRGATSIRNLPQSTGAINYFYPSNDPNWTTSEPIHIAITWDKSLDSDHIKLYLNGELTGVREHGDNLQSPWIYDELHYLYVGSRMYSGDWNRHNWEPNIDGVIDNIIVWDYAKTDFSNRSEENPINNNPQTCEDFDAIYDKEILSLDALATEFYNPVTDKYTGEFSLFTGNTVLQRLPGFYDFEYIGGDLTYAKQITSEENCYPTYSASQKTLYLPKVVIPMVSVLPDWLLLEGPQLCYEALLKHANTQEKIFTLVESTEIPCE